LREKSPPLLPVVLKYRKGHEIRGPFVGHPGPALVARHADAAGMNDINLNPVPLKQPGQPEPILIRRLLAPALDLLQQARWVDRQLLQRPAVQSRHRRGHQLGRAAHLDYAHQRALRVGCDAGLGQVVGLGQRLLHRCQCNEGASDLIVRPITSRGSLFRHLGRPYHPM
jgi:hypothetical protein